MPDKLVVSQSYVMPISLPGGGAKKVGGAEGVHYRDFATVAIECFPAYLSVSKSYLGSYLLLYL